MDKIEIENMEFYAFHGCYREENITGNRFLVSLSLEGNFARAATTDALGDAVNYQTAYNIVKKEMVITSKLLENVCQRILNSLYDNLADIEKACVKVSKMNPPMGGKIEKVSVTLCR